MSQAIDRRRFERFEVSPMYTPVAIRLLDEPTFTHTGHAYDISEGGVRFDLDQPIAPGTPIVIRLDLPLAADGTPLAGGPGRAVFAFANTVWLNEDDLPGDVNMAAAFTRFAHANDKARLLMRFATHGVRRAA